jgi:hypothetical protein
MPRRHKSYLTSLGFFDLAVAAPSMKAALEAWGAGSNLFHQGKETESWGGRRDDVKTGCGPEAPGGIEWALR